ncbi:Hint domain-containing protein [uncultured Roseobacter sp.]|uniref:Hint domain-containing protein n=1 Tax=uncultured Roseobacter sp. TaxID=114847 RepID=UPI002626B457|nr:Hint domain-containing protein [uncultured Roseobacter sp.]
MSPSSFSGTTSDAPASNPNARAFTSEVTCDQAVDQERFEAEEGDIRSSSTQKSVVNVPGFGPGTMVQTENGELPVEWLDTSDKVLTRDHGYQPISWVCRSRLPVGYFVEYPDDRPICIPAGSLGSNQPTHDLFVHRDHRLLVASVAADALFFANEVLVPANAWLDSGHAHYVETSQDYKVTHLACARHQVILAQGVWSETVLPGCESLTALPTRDQFALRKAVGASSFNQNTARPCVTREEAKLLIEPQQIRRPMFRFVRQKRSA